MPKNVTVQVNDKLAAKMKRLPDVNWSYVVRDCLEHYCNIRLNPNIEALAQKMKEEKEEAESGGYKIAWEWVKQGSVGYKDVDRIFREYEALEAEFDSHIEKQYGSYQKAEDEGVNVNTLWETQERAFWTDIVVKALGELHYEYDVSSAFIEGFKNALKKLKGLI